MTTDWTAELTREQFSSLFSADLTHLMTTLVALNLRSNAVMTDITSRDVAYSTRHTTPAYNKIYHVR